ncbi:MAG TPA: sigma-70 family RNA polymerase sigma factor [Rhizomicrobium sp.]|nr:sigma-70 family RNA polymerase sigma factor [Rhizomicrobium sp.]
MSARDVAAWFVREVLPLEPVLTQYLHRNWHNSSEIVDLRQEVYARVCLAAQKQFPDETQRFVLATARNLLIDRLRSARAIPFERATDALMLDLASDIPGPDRIAIARDELRRLQVALDQLPPRCREAMVFAHIEGLTGHEIAQRMNISPQTVSAHLNNGLRLLANILHGEEPAEGKAKP